MSRWLQSYLLSWSVTRLFSRSQKSCYLTVVKFYDITKNDGTKVLWVFLNDFYDFFFSPNKQNWLQHQPLDWSVPMQQTPGWISSTLGQICPVFGSYFAQKSNFGNQSQSRCGSSHVFTNFESTKFGQTTKKNHETFLVLFF